MAYGRSFEAAVFPECDAGARWDGVFPPFEMEFVIVVADEEEGRGGAVVGGIGRVAGGEVCEGLLVVVSFLVGVMGEMGGGGGRG